MKRIFILLLTCFLVFAFIPVNVISAADTPTFEVEQTSAKPGETVQLTVSVENNPGIINFQLLVSYDSDALELVRASEGDFAGLAYGQSVSQNPYAISWSDAIHPDNTTNGVAVVLTFLVKEDAPAGLAVVTVGYKDDNVFNSSWDNVAFDVIPGGITVGSSVPSFSLGSTDGNSLSTEDNSAFLSNRYTEGADTFDLRLVLVSEESYIAYGDVVEITFVKDGTAPYIITRTIAEEYVQGETMKLYDSVIAAGETYTAAEGCVLYGAVIIGIPLEGFDSVTVTVCRDSDVIVTGTLSYEAIKPAE
ncbi:MAG: cohesin domain-containing protein [Eubacteriales bacterium]